MEKHVIDLFTNEIKTEIAARFGSCPEALNLLGEHENFIFSFTKHNHKYILRITHSSHRNEALLKAELDWIKYMTGCGIAISTPVLSERKRLIEVIPVQGSCFYASAFTFAPGQNPTAKDWNETFFCKWGKFLGKMHRITRSYPHFNYRSKRRLHWFEDNYAMNGLQALPAEQNQNRQKLKHFFAELRTLPVNKYNYGLIHSDLHHGNFHIHQNELIAFDTDDSNYHWFMSDMAVAYFYAIRHSGSGNDRAAFAKVFVPAMWYGYQQENKLDPSWFELFQTFLKLREYTCYNMLHIKWDMDRLSQTQQERYDDYRYRIENDVPYVELDIPKLIDRTIIALAS